MHQFVTSNILPWQSLSPQPPTPKTKKVPVKLNCENSLEMIVFSLTVQLANFVLSLGSEANCWTLLFITTDWGTKQNNEKDSSMTPLIRYTAFSCHAWKLLLQHRWQMVKLLVCFVCILFLTLDSKNFKWSTLHATTLYAFQKNCQPCMTCNRQPVQSDTLP